MKQLDQSTQPPPDMKPVFENIIKNRLWRDVTCGSGSTIQNTHSVRDQLVPLLQRHNINSMADIPCGDYSWMNLVEFPDNFKYIGGDIVGFMIEENRKKHPGVDFREFDLSQDLLPEVDLLFCRDCLFHFSLADLKITLANISRSSVKYVMITTYDNGNNQDIKTGGFRPLDFTKAPFNLPAPIDVIVENIEGEQPRKIALWPIDAIRRCTL